MLLLLGLRSMPARAEVDPFDNVLVGVEDRGALVTEADLAASSFVRARPCVSILMLACACLPGLLMLGLSSPLTGKPSGWDVGKEASRKGDPT